MSELSDFQKLQDDIVNRLAPDSPNGTGWRTCYCPSCKDTRRKTAGVLVDGDSIAINCFKAKCDGNVVYTLGEPMSRKFRDLCKQLDVKIPVSLSMKKSKIKKELESLDLDLFVQHSYKDMNVPAGWLVLTPEVNKIWSNYFKARKISLDNVYFISKGIDKGKAAIALRWYDKTIGFQICDPNGVVKYRTISDNSHILAINYPMISTAIVVEGVLDALSIPGGVGLLGSRLTPEQAYHLRGRDVILLPDRSGNKFVDIAKTYGWKVCIPKWDCNDVNQAVQRYGIMVVCRMIRENTYSNLTKAKIAYEQWRVRDE